MKKVLVIVPFAMSADNLLLREQQLAGLQFGPDIVFEYRTVRAGPANYSSHHDFVLADVANFEAGCRAADEGYAAVCIDTMSDSGVAALRSVLDIPVFGPGKVSMLTALMLGDRFSILTMASRWKPLYKKALDELGLHHKCASVRAIEVPPDNQACSAGKEEEVFPLLEQAARKAIDEDGAEVLILGSTTMHQAHAYLAERLPVPVINPGPLSYKMAEAALALGLRHSRAGLPGADASAAGHAASDACRRRRLSAGAADGRTRRGRGRASRMAPRAGQPIAALVERYFAAVDRMDLAATLAASPRMPG